MSNTSARSNAAKRCTLPLRMNMALKATSPNPTIRSSSSSNNSNFKYLLYGAVALGVQVLLIRSIWVSLTLDDRDHHLLVEQQQNDGQDLAVSLEFIHITKTGGTAIEVAGANVGIAWGLCHFERRRGMGAGCQRPNWASKKLQVRTTVLPDFRGELWHTPPTFFVNDPFQGKDTFAVVRNPYDRIVSEYYCPHYGYHRADGDGGSKWRMQKAFMARAEQYRSFEKNGAAVGADPSSPGFPSRHRHHGRHASSPPPPPNDPDGFRRWMERSVALRKQTKREELERYHEQQQRRPQQHHQPQPDSDTPIAVQQWMDQAMSKQVELEQPTQYRPRPPHGRRRLMGWSDSKRRQPKRISKRRPPKHDTPESLNRWVLQQLYTINLNTGHMLPQHYYCFHQGSQVVTHILKYENLQDEFSLLMEQYNLTAVSLPVQNVNAGHAEKMGKKKLTKMDLFPETIRMINEYMAEDFELLGYDMMGV